jgi:hypothetical protein
MPTPDQPINPTLGLLFIVAQHLMPLFKIGTIDNHLARQMAVSAIEAYHPETRADYINVARTIACSITSLALLGNTASPDMTPPEKNRAIGRAIALNRAADQSERTMMQRRRHHKANPPAEIPSPMPAPEATTTQPTMPKPPTASQPQTDDAEIQAAVAGVMQEYLSVGVANPIPPAAQPQRPAAPFRIDLPKPPSNRSYKQELLQNSAILCAGGQTTAPPAR